MPTYGKSGQPAGYIQHVNGTPALQDVAKRAGDFMHSWYSNPETLRILEENMRDAGIHYGSVLGEYSPASYDAKDYAELGLKTIDDAPVYFIGNNKIGANAFIGDNRALQLTGDQLEKFEVDDPSKLTSVKLDSDIAKLGVNGYFLSNDTGRRGTYNFYTGKDRTKKESYNIQEGSVSRPDSSNYLLMNAKSAKFSLPTARVPLLAHEFTHGMALAAPKVTLTNLMEKYGLQGKGSSNYGEGAEEGYSKLNEIRSALQMSPNKRNYTEKEIPAMMQKLIKSDPNVYVKTYQKWSKLVGKKNVNKFMADMFNNVAQNDAPTTTSEESYFPEVLENLNLYAKKRRIFKIL